MERDLNFGDVVGGTLDTLLENGRAAIIYLVVFTTVGSSLQLLATEFPFGPANENALLGAVQGAIGLGAGIAGIVIFVLAIIGQYLLWEAMLSRPSLQVGLPRRRYLAFLGLLIISGIGTAIGFVFLIVPGLIILARWSIAPALLIKERQGITEALENSWNTIKGRTSPIVWAVLAGVVGLGLLSGAVGGSVVFMGGSIETNPMSIIFEQAVSDFGTLLSVSLGVFLYRHFYGEAKEIVEVFS